MSNSVPDYAKFIDLNSQYNEFLSHLRRFNAFRSEDNASAMLSFLSRHRNAILPRLGATQRNVILVAGRLVLEAKRERAASRSRLSYYIAGKDLEEHTYSMSI